MKTIRILFLLCITLILAACETAPKTNELDLSLLSQPNIKVAVVLGELPNPDYYLFGSQGLLDIAINKSLGKNIDKKIEQLDAESFIGIREKVVQKLQDSGVDVFSYPELLEIEYTKGSSENDKLNSTQPYDYNEENQNTVDVSQVIADVNADKVFVVQLTQFGASRHYYGFTPLGDPKGYAKIQMFSVNADNTVEWQLNKLAGVVIDETVIGEWKQPPEYTNLTKASLKALKTAEEYVLEILGQNQI